MVLDFSALVASQMSAIQSGLPTILNFGVGTVFRAFIDSNAALALSLQQEILNIFNMSRASTSTGSDLDSWMGDFGLVRINATYATGDVTFSRFTPATQAIIPIGTTVESFDGSSKFNVILDVTNPNYNVNLTAYVIPAGISSVTVPVEAKMPGLIGNMPVGGVVSLSQSISGVDTVTNSVAFVNAMDSESDTAFRLRFIMTLASLNKATKKAIVSDIAAIQANLQYTLVENYTITGTPRDGYFYVVIDDGTGSPSSTLLTSVYNIVDESRPLCSSFDIYPPTIRSIDVSVTIIVADGVSHSATAVNIVDAITNYINNLGLGSSLYYTMLPKIIYEYDTNIVNVTSIIINHNVIDVIASKTETLKAGNVVVN